MTNDTDTILRELLSASISYDESLGLLKTNRGRGIAGGLEKKKLRLIAGDAKVRLIRAQNAALAVINKRNGK